MLCPVLFLLLPLLNNSKGFFLALISFLLSLVAPPPDFEKIDFWFSTMFCACYNYIVALTYSCSVRSNLLTVIIPNTRTYLCHMTLVLASLVLIKLLTHPLVLMALFLQYFLVWEYIRYDLRNVTRICAEIKFLT